MKSFQSSMAERAHAEIVAFRKKQQQEKEEKLETVAAGVEDKNVETDQMKENSGKKALADELDDLESYSGTEEEGTANVGPQRPDQFGHVEEVEAYPEVESRSISEEEMEENKELEEDEEEGKQQELESLTDARPFKRRISMLNECRSVENYEKLNRISEGTYGIVYRYVTSFTCL